MKHIILGTAGHVDHGKTALIKALTGTDTDRLKEEKARGITIELGFAQLALKNGQTIGIVDVPGHERFVKNMVAGAGGIDVVALIIAADEGIMPQTREHLHICQLLGIKNGLVALTKTDLVDEEWRDLVIEDVTDFLTGTFLEGVPIVPISSVTAEGIDEFLEALEQIIDKTEERADPGFFRLPIDRVFTMKGFGTVITGTLLSGHIRTGDAVEIMPLQRKAKIRGIQIHNKSSDEATAGQRTAMNLQGVGRDAIQRGGILCEPDTFEPSTRLDVSFEYLPTATRKLKNRTPVRFHTGTSEIISRIILLDRDEIEPGDRVYAQIILETPTITMAGDHYVIRSYSPIDTIGGGIILDPAVKKHKRFSDKTIADLTCLAGEPSSEKTMIILERAGLAGISSRALSVRTGMPLKMQHKLLEAMFSKRTALLLDREEHIVVSASLYATLQDKMVAELRTFHENFPLKEGCPKEELRIRIGEYIAPKLFNRALRDLEKGNKIFAEKEIVRIPEHRVNLAGDMEDLKNRILRLYRDAQLTVPTTKELMEQFPGKQNDTANVLTVMVNEGLLVKVNEDMYFYKDHLDVLTHDYRTFLTTKEQATPSTFRELTGLSRKYSIPLMEYFDKIKLTIRVGDHRILRERKDNAPSR